MGLLLSVAATGFSQTAPFDIEVHPKVTPWLDSLGLITYDRALGEYVHDVIRDSDDQQITGFSYDNQTGQFTLSLENGGSAGVSLAALDNEIQVISHILKIVGGTNTYDLSQYLDNTDDQQLEGFNYNNGVLSISLEDGGTQTVNIQDAETDPIASTKPSWNITTTDITNWNNDDVDDADSDPGNEFDPVTIGQSEGHNVTLEGPRLNGGNKQVIQYFVDSSLTAFGFGVGSGTDDQILTWDAVNYTLQLENGGAVADLSVLDNSKVDQVEIENVSTSTLTSPISLPGKRKIFINGVLCKELVTRTHIQHITINGNEISFYESLDGDTVFIDVAN